MPENDMLLSFLMTAFTLWLKLIVKSFKPQLKTEWITDMLQDEKRTAMLCATLLSDHLKGLMCLKRSGCVFSHDEFIHYCYHITTELILTSAVVVAQRKPQIIGFSPKNKSGKQSRCLQQYESESNFLCVWLYGAASSTEHLKQNMKWREGWMDWRRWRTLQSLTFIQVEIWVVLKEEFLFRSSGS